MSVEFTACAGAALAYAWSVVPTELFLSLYLSKVR